MKIIKNMKAKDSKDYTLKEMIIYITIMFLMISCAIGIIISLLLSMFQSSIPLLFLTIFFGFLEIFPTATYFYISNYEP